MALKGFVRTRAFHRSFWLDDRPRAVTFSSVQFSSFYFALLYSCLYSQRNRQDGQLNLLC